ncbi:MAG: hypothetical protein RDU20_10895 [Desulfomonilaceae bacterium]|nr:hypothetical protein [Desulfomonilaceae bacterium]
MSSSERKWWSFSWFPKRRFDPDFPLAFWFAGLWFNLKSFLYLCYLYMIGTEPPPYTDSEVVEAVYFGIALLPSLCLGLALWNEKKWAVIPAIVFLVLDTPLLLFHVLRLAEAGFLESGLTRALEFGSLVLNVTAVGWLIKYRAGSGATRLARQ